MEPSKPGRKPYDRERREPTIFELWGPVLYWLTEPIPVPSRFWWTIAAASTPSVVQRLIADPRDAIITMIVVTVAIGALALFSFRRHPGTFLDEGPSGAREHPRILVMISAFFGGLAALANLWLVTALVIHAL